MPANVLRLCSSCDKCGKSEDIVKSEICVLHSTPHEDHEILYSDCTYTETMVTTHVALLDIRQFGLCAECYHTIARQALLLLGGSALILAVGLGYACYRWSPLMDHGPHAFWDGAAWICIPAGLLCLLGLIWSVSSLYKACSTTRLTPANSNSRLVQFEDVACAVYKREYPGLELHTQILPVGENHAKVTMLREAMDDSKLKGLVGKVIRPCSRKKCPACDRDMMQASAIHKDEAVNLLICPSCGNEIRITAAF